MFSYFRVSPTCRHRHSEEQNNQPNDNSDTTTATMTMVDEFIMITETTVTKRQVAERQW